ncbi:hypothetical protein FEM48_Zijuj07G0059700 [Ziziphus jujuba var. spinosa]|uniref:Histone deacetylase interacting domain-containing protein n=1 Tax=Ziziphus jujuba var. spinosa TaxID=714518 RepID=A0A978V2V8_ZIZJJ|nr:hypothetical protein FEM48_Zijuj07G0059700 [Ziziphus jujuba var. spinosa]
MEDRLGVAVSLVNKIISRFVSDADADHHDYTKFEAFLKLMSRYKNVGLTNTKEIREKCALLFSDHSDILEELSYFFTAEIPNFVPKKKRVQRVSSKFLVDKRKRDLQAFEDQGQVEFEENNNLFQCGDYAEVGFNNFDEERKKLGISVEYFQFLMCSSFRISRDELETMVAPIVANMVDKFPQKNPDLIKKFVHDFVGFCRYVQDHDRNLSAGCSKKEESEEKLEKRKRRKLGKKKQKKRELPFAEVEKICNGCPLVTVANKKPENKSVMDDCLVSGNSTGSNDNTKPKKRNKDEEAAINKYENKRFKLDIVLNPLRSAIKKAERLQNLIAEKTALALETPIDLDKYFTVLDLKCIKSVYGYQRKEVRDILGRNISVSLSVALTRMKRKRKEVEQSLERLKIDLEMSSSDSD